LDTGLISFKQSPPLSIGRTPRSGLDLASIPALAGTVRRIAALADDTFDGLLLG
jgi:hypothetical protein